MESRSPEPEGGSVREELQRVFASVLLVCVLFTLAVLLEPPISILTWLLLSPGFLSLFYVVLAVRRLLRKYQSTDQTKKP
jgi:cytochrome c-type biogenesis protein CcmH/NrfF